MGCHGYDVTQFAVQLWFAAGGFVFCYIRAQRQPTLRFYYAAGAGCANMILLARPMRPQLKPKPPGRHANTQDSGTRRSLRTDYVSLIRTLLCGRAIQLFHEASNALLDVCECFCVARLRLDDRFPQLQGIQE